MGVTYTNCVVAAAEEGIEQGDVRKSSSSSSVRDIAFEQALAASSGIEKKVPEAKLMAAAKSSIRMSSEALLFGCSPWGRHV